MFEKEIKFISDFSLNKVKKLGSFVTFEKLVGTDIHPAIITYISAELDYMIYRDRKKLLADSIFDYSGRELSDYFKKIAVELKRSKKISLEDVKKLIIQAVSFNINYVVRPKWSLTKLIYNDQDSVSVDELERMLNYLYYYDYIKNVLSAYISKRKVVQLSLTEFELILNKIDRELFKSNAEELINNALLSIADFFNIGGININQVSLSGVEILLKEKNMIDYLLKLRHAIPDDSRKKYDINDIKSVLYSVMPGKTETAPETESDDIDLKDDQYSDETESSKSGTDTRTVTEDNNRPQDAIDVEDKSASEDENDFLPIEEEFLEETQKDNDKPELEIDEKITENNEQPGPGVKSGSALGIDMLTTKKFNLNETIPELKANESEEDITNDNIELEGTLEDEEQITKEFDLNKIIPELDVTNRKESFVDENGDLASDELLDFYEKELESMKETISPQIDDENELQSRDKSETESIKTQQDRAKGKEQESSEKVGEHKVNDSKDEISDDDFDLSVFDDLRDGESDNELSNKINNGIDQAGSSDEEITEIKKAKEQNSDINLRPEKEIIIEMLNDLKGDINVDKKLLDKESGATDKSEKGLTTGSGSASIEQTSDERNSASKLSGGSPFEEDISEFIDGIDEVIEQNTAADKSEEGGTVDSGKESSDKIVGGKSDADELISLYDTITEGGKSDREKMKKDNSSGKTSVSENKVEEQVRQLDVPAKEKDLLSYLSKKEAKKIISNIFAGDEEDFVTTIERVSACSSYKEATEIIKGVYFVYRVSSYAKEAVIFSNAVSNYFRQV